MILDDDFQDIKPNIKLTDQEIFIKIWTSPRLVFRYLKENKYDKYVPVLLILAGISRAFDRASTKNMGDSQSLLSIILTCVIFGGIFGWIGYYIYASILSGTGSWFNGKGNTKSILRTIAYAMIPLICGLFFVILNLVLFGKAIFQSQFDVQSMDIAIQILFYLFLALEVALAIWTLVIFVIGLSEIQELSIEKTILNIMLPILIIFGTVALFGLLISLIN